MHTSTQVKKSLHSAWKVAYKSGSVTLCDNIKPRSGRIRKSFTTKEKFLFRW